ncbi:MAG TPA: L-2-hydroxyglutarate oxidase [Mycobacteriales bacterium]|nr:L-2-hydroxyglutarate oxidase [Mycobacteriales bacterium]
MDRYDVVIVGGGIVGLATALALAHARPDLRVLVAEKEAELATHQTGHNSGVIHTGVYYAPGSLKARFARAGARRMVEFCRAQGLPVALPGKVIVATDARELPGLHRLAERAAANGVEASLIGSEELAEREPHVAGLRALWVPGAGICDFVAVARRYAELVLKAGGEVWTSAEVVSIRSSAGRTIVGMLRGEVEARCLVTCAGLYGDKVAGLAGRPPRSRIVPFRGEYYELAPGRRDLVRGLVYPVPDPRFPFLGVHLTRMIDGSVHAGPNAVLALRREGYRWRDVSPAEVRELAAYAGLWRMARRHWRMGLHEVWRSVSKPAFTRSVARLVPAVTGADLVRAGAGVRAQALLPDGGLADDFLIDEEDHAVHVLNAPSPAATASLPIGEEIARRVLARF